MFTIVWEAISKWKINRKIVNTLLTLLHQTVSSQTTYFKPNVNITSWFTNNPIGLWLRVTQLPSFLQVHFFQSSITVNQSTTFPHPRNIPVCQNTLLLGSLLSANKNTCVQQSIIMVRFPADARDFSLFEIAHNGSTAHPAYSMDRGGFFSGLKCSGSERDHPLLLVPKFRTSRTIPPCRLSSWRHRSFTFALFTMYNNNAANVLISEVAATLVTATLWPEIVYSNKSSMRLLLR